ncbi:hypothetical protein F7725_026419 [Dissostichus mawsoni]|uniref:Uncharacterized protein n=1 Tax=Dissostichus mawsoni TaxID=36200 RepID=A0A7J5X6Y8_DISMA|nr:hypothetical protein F7725_026419 [Dissostichus mawsoni]
MGGYRLQPEQERGWLDCDSDRCLENGDTMGGKLSKKRKGYDVSDPNKAKDEIAATVTAAVEAVAPAIADVAAEATIVVKEAVEAVVSAAVPEPEPVAEAAAVLEQAPEPEPETKPEPAPELEQLPELVVEAVKSAAEKKVEEVEPEPMVATSDTTELGTVDAEAPTVLETAPEEEYVAAEPAAAEPVPEIVISESVSANQLPTESEEVAEASAEELPCPEPEVESKMENGDIESSSVTDVVAEVDAFPTVNGECTNYAATPTEECVNGNEKPEETQIKEQSDFELKKEVKLSGDVQEVLDAVSGMAEGLCTEVTQAV